jgi:hypothetical protein
LGDACVEPNPRDAVVTRGYPGAMIARQTFGR